MLYNKYERKNWEKNYEIFWKKGTEGNRYIFRTP